jgi:diguanylate cyclase
MLWKRKPEATPEATSAPAPRAADSSVRDAEEEAALSAVADFIKTFGHNAFDTDETEAAELARQCDSWVSDLLVSFTLDDAGKPRRNWPGLRHFLRKARQNEAAYVTRSMGNLREAIQTFAQCLTVAVHEDRQVDDAVEQNLTGLIDILSSNKDTQKVREEVVAVVGRVRDAMDKRRKREERQMALLSQRLRNLRSELTEAKVAASIDSLTKLSNRQAFDAQVQRLRDLGLLFSSPPCLLMIDIDHFKVVNDTYGHPGGDVVLQEVSKCLLRTFMRKQDFVARFGGEEFAVLLVDTNLPSVVELAERARATLQQKVIGYGEHQISVTMSIGVAALLPGQSTTDWLKRADEALYEAKAGGRNCFRMATVEASPSSIPSSQLRAGLPTGVRASG